MRWAFFSSGWDEGTRQGGRGSERKGQGRGRKETREGGGERKAAPPNIVSTATHSQYRLQVVFRGNVLTYK